MKRKSIWFVLLAVSVLFAATPALAQVPPNAPAHLMQPDKMAVLAMCSTTDYTDVVAKALSMTAGELRVALVSGTTLEDLAATKKIEIDVINEAISAVRKAELDQAVKDG